MGEPSVIGDWKKISILGSGGFGVVTLWRNENTQQTIAVKKCRWDIPQQIPEKQRRRWTNEVDIMRKIDHENIVSYKNIPEELYIGLSNYNHSKLPLLPMEYCSQGNLRRYLSAPQNACGLQEIEVRYVLRDLLSAISYLHTLNITHRDIKPENIVLQKSDLRPNKHVFKLIDLGYAKELNSEVASFVGTLHYLAPEIFLNDDYTNTVDYWSFGIVAFEVICGEYPFLPKSLPIERFEYLQKKSPDDICIYTTRSGEIKYSKQIVKENHISTKLKLHLEDWLKIMLKYDKTQRGKTGTDKNIFEELQGILNRNIICVFSVFNYNMYHYEVDENTLLTKLQEWIEVDTGIKIKEQLLITDNMYYEDDPERKVVSCFDEINCNTVLVLFKRGEYVDTKDTTLPVAIKNLLCNPNKEYTWNCLFPQIALAVHFITQEVKFMKAYRRAFLIEFDYLRNLLKRESVMFESLKGRATKMLIEIEFCKDVNAEMRDIWTDGSNVERVRNYRKYLWQCRELIENVNSVTSRHAKLQSKQNVLQASSKAIHDLLHQFNPDQLNEDAMTCMIINTQKAIIKSTDIIKVVERCLKIRHTIMENEFIKQHLMVTSKILREINRLFKWMRALEQEIEKVSNGIRLNHIETVKHFNVPKSRESNSVLTLDIESLSIEDLDSSNKNLRYNTQDILSHLLSTYKTFISDLNPKTDLLLK